MGSGDPLCSYKVLGLSAFRRLRRQTGGVCNPGGKRRQLPPRGRKGLAGESRLLVEGGSRQAPHAGPGFGKRVSAGCPPTGCLARGDALFSFRSVPFPTAAPRHYRSRVDKCVEAAGRGLPPTLSSGHAGPWPAGQSQAASRAWRARLALLGPGAFLLTRMPLYSFSDFKRQNPAPLKPKWFLLFT